ncbi:MAG TPA: cupin domain-containing protein [Terrabacter sp.]|nr:cupin domain-containing protein [Terrabacter sp.]
MSLHIPLDTARTVTTAAATMRTLVSPSTSPAMEVAVWRTELPAGAAGPRHTIDGDQLVVVVSGTVAVDVDDTAYEVGAGDAFLLPGGSPRVLAAAGGEPATTITVGRPGARAAVGDGEPVPVPWTA